MNKTTVWILIAIIGVMVGCLLGAVTGGLIVWFTAPRWMGWVRFGPGIMWWPGPKFEHGADTSNGKLIYYTGVNQQGERIPLVGGPTWLYMRGGGCVSCHGESGRGGVPVMMGTKIPPDIRYEQLLEEEHEEGEEDEEHHPPYTDETIKRAIAEGVDPAGESLDPTMPSFRMSEEDLDDLLEYLKELD